MASPPQPKSKNGGRKDEVVLQRPLGVDYGARRSGLALSVGGFAPRPLTIIDNRGRDRNTLATEIVDIGKKNQVDGFIVGVPILPGERITNEKTYSTAAARCRNFALTLAAIAHPLPVYLVDEAMSSKEAASLVLDRDIVGSYDKRTAPRMDAVSASLLLERYYASPQHALRMRLPRAPRTRAPPPPSSPSFSEQEMEAHLKSMEENENDPFWHVDLAAPPPPNPNPTPPL